MGYSYYWEEGEEQSYLVKNGKTISCTTVCNVPTVSLGTQVEMRHEPSSSESSSNDDEDNGRSSETYSSRSSLSNLSSNQSSVCSSRSSSRGSSASSCSSRTSSRASSHSSMPSRASSSSNEDVFDRALAPFDLDVESWDDEIPEIPNRFREGSQAPTPRESADGERESDSPHSSSGSKSLRPTKRLSARERKAKNKKNTINTSLKNSHNPFTHFPKDPLCPICNKTKCRRQGIAPMRAAKRYP